MHERTKRNDKSNSLSLNISSLSKVTQIKVWNSTILTSILQLFSLIEILKNHFSEFCVDKKNH
jgi:hypothetical protein